MISATLGERRSYGYRGVWAVLEPAIACLGQANGQHEAGFCGSCRTTASLRNGTTAPLPCRARIAVGIPITSNSAPAILRSRGFFVVDACDREIIVWSGCRQCRRLWEDGARSDGCRGRTPLRGTKAPHGSNDSQITVAPISPRKRPTPPSPWG